MKNNNATAKVIIIFFLLPVVSKPVAAFISPSTLALIGASIGSAVWGFIVIVAVNVFIFFKKSKTYITKIVVCLSVVLLVSLLISATHKFQKLKEINEFRGEGTSISEIQEWQKFLASFGADITENLTLKHQGDLIFKGDADLFIPYSNKTVKRINLEQAIQNGSYKILRMFTWGPILGINATPTRLDKLLYMPYSEELFQNLTREYNLSKEDRIVIYCETGYSSRIIALIFAFNGYDASYSASEDIENEMFVQAGFINSKSRNKIIINSLAPEKKDSFILFLFWCQDIELLTTPRFNKLIKDNVKVVCIDSDLYSLTYGYIYIDAVEDFQELHDKIDLVQGLEDGDMKDRKVICRNKLHCFLTENYLYYLNATDVRTIYLFEDETNQ